ncbi:hypothetical protein FYK55_10860 [Roseiconus nitratireducens]|uniref:Uncharacterized protein n=1 Tax=Roseiconus nitratireducens TaxID=2605748 RepID=A0A5M6DC81_9BACT|nr:hypothetical protein [Roseiconus nitratireducens]KAA5543689.1 hypothetical protein FYK55_10860 [Roseiconus nitratireducens]
MSSTVIPSPWTDFWFRPSPIWHLTWVRRALCLVTAGYFASALPDVSTWYVSGAPASSSNLATFFRTAELTDQARWMFSPLYLWDSAFAMSPLSEAAWVYQAYLLIGIALAVLVAVANPLYRFERLPRVVSSLLAGSLPCVLLWIWFVGWANRAVLLAGITEPVLSVSLAALAIAPSGVPALDRLPVSKRLSWRTTLSRRLIAVQATLIALMTTATMLASPIWWNGMGAYALVAPVQDRLIDVRETFFENSIVYESLTLLLVLVLPLGFWLAWRPNTRRLALGLIAVWATVVAFLSANILYAVTLAIIATSIGQPETDG